MPTSQQQEMKKEKIKNRAIKWAEIEEKKVKWWNLLEKLDWYIWKIRHENDIDF